MKPAERFINLQPRINGIKEVTNMNFEVNSKHRKIMLLRGIPAKKAKPAARTPYKTKLPKAGTGVDTTAVMYAIKNTSRTQGWRFSTKPEDKIVFFI